MSKKNFITSNDIESGSKRINITLNMKDVEKLVLLSSDKSIQPTTLAKMYVVKGIKGDEKNLKKNNELPGQQRLFEK